MPRVPTTRRGAQTDELEGTDHMFTRTITLGCGGFLNSQELDQQREQQRRNWQFADQFHSEMKDKRAGKQGSSTALAEAELELRLRCRA